MTRPSTHTAHPACRPLIHLKHMNAIPRGTPTPRLPAVLLQQHHARKSLIQIPQIHTPRRSPARALALRALVIHRPIHVERRITLDLHAPNSVGRVCGILLFGGGEGRVEFVGPGRAVGVAVTVVVAEEEGAGVGGVCGGGEGLVDGGEEVFGQGGRECREGLKVRGDGGGWEAAEEVAGQVLERRTTERDEWRGSGGAR
jgi:hypothetical protein